MGNKCMPCCKTSPDLQVDIEAKNNRCCSWWKSDCRQCCDNDNDKCVSNCCMIQIIKSNSKSNLNSKKDVSEICLTPNDK